MSGSYRSASSTAPAHSAVAVSPNDVTGIPVTRALYIGTAGTLVVVMADDENTVTFTDAPVGILPIQVSRVLSTGTVATNIVALY